jgi:hypothetical protein
MTEKVQKISADLSNLSRVETGVLQINSDWPGVFIRGDNAAGYAMYLDQILRIMKSESEMFDGCQDFMTSISIINLEGLKKLLESSNNNNWKDEE